MATPTGSMPTPTCASHAPMRPLVASSSRAVLLVQVRDVAWAPNVGNGIDVVASCSQDKKVIVWTCTGSEWTLKTIQLSSIMWSVSWSVTGGVLAVAGGDNQVTLWKEDTLTEWKQIGKLSEDTAPESAAY